jgi:prepilin-type N-terminal cleavage/methylation domain-containing protein
VIRGNSSQWPRPRARRPSGQRGITLIELLVSMTILAVVTSMILVVWFSLQNSFAYSVDASHQREAARDAVSRMTMVIRDAQSAFFVGQTAVTPAITVAEPSEIDFNTSYAQIGNANVLPNSGTSANYGAVVRACFLYVPSSSNLTDGKIYYLVDANGNGLADELASPSTKGTVIVDHVVNNERPTSSGTPVFTYTYFADNGTMTQATSISGVGVSPSRIYSVQIHVLVDLNPGHAPVYMDLQSTAQPRNMRPST